MPASPTSHGTTGPLFGARITHGNIRVVNERAGLRKIDGLAPYGATVGIGEVREFGQIDVPDFTGDPHTRLEAYGSPEAVRPADRTRLSGASACGESGQAPPPARTAVSDSTR